VRTLFIAPQVPWPLDVGSKIRVFHLLESYSRLGPVTLVCFAQNPAEAQMTSGLRDIVESVHCSALTGKPRTGGKWGALLQALQPLPGIMREFQDAALTAEVEALLAGDRFDVVHVERIFMAQNLTAAARRAAAAGGVLRILDVDDLESAKLWRKLSLDPWWGARRWLSMLEYLKLRRYERRVLSWFDLSLVCSQLDRRRIEARRPFPAVRVVSNGADPTTIADAPVDDARTLVFLGAMNYQPNAAAVSFFVAAIFPLIKRTIAAARFIIAGKSPPASVAALDNGSDVLVHGYVDDKQALLAACTVFVVPIRTGGGTRIKILEAMAAGKPVVSTTIGCEGIEATTGVDILVADSPQAFADACIQLLESAERRAAVGRAGRELVVRRYRWEAIQDEFVAALKSLRHSDGLPVGHADHSGASVTILEARGIRARSGD
jgi:glycosyltransferase involved in cell wall biosynthesis